MSTLSTLLSSVDAVFEIKDGRCMVNPGVPVLSRIRVEAGDTIQLRHPDGTVANCQIRGIGTILGSDPELASLPLFLGDNLPKARLPIGSQLWINAPTANILHYQFPSVAFEDLASQLFREGENGHIRFGENAVTMHPASIDDLLNGALEFRDYVSEGFVSYLISVATVDNGIQIAVSLFGMDRDELVQEQVDRYLEETGLAFNRGPVS